MRCGPRLRCRPWRSGSPVCDITDVIDSSRSACSMASVWTIIPPIETPITWARSTPLASSTAIASAAMSDERVGRAAARRPGRRRSGVERPTSRLSKRITWNPAATNFSHQASAVVDALAAEPVDEEQRRVGGRPERLVVEFAVVVAREGHGAGTYRRLRSGEDYGRGVFDRRRRPDRRTRDGRRAGPRRRRRRPDAHEPRANCPASGRVPRWSTSRRVTARPTWPRRGP